MNSNNKCNTRFRITDPKGEAKYSKNQYRYVITNIFLEMQL